MAMMTEFKNKYKLSFSFRNVEGFLMYMAGI